MARLLPTTAATTVRRDPDQPVMLDGPIAKNKEQLLGFYVVECADLEEVLAIARELGKASPSGADEIRPLAIFRLGQIGATA